MRYVLFAMGLLSLLGCDGSDVISTSNGDVAYEEQKDVTVIVDGEVSSDQLKDTAVMIDGYKQITITSDSDVKLRLKSGESFVLNSTASAPEKLIIQGKLTITSN